MTFSGVSPRPFLLCQSWSGSCGVDYFFAHLAFLVPQHPRHFHFLPPLLLVVSERQQGHVYVWLVLLKHGEVGGKLEDLWAPAFQKKVDLNDGKVITKCAQMTLYFTPGGLP